MTRRLPRAALLGLGLLASLPAPALQALANNPNVKHISPDRNLQGAMDYAAPTVGATIARSSTIRVSRTTVRVAMMMNRMSCW